MIFLVYHINKPFTYSLLSLDFKLSKPQEKKRILILLGPKLLEINLKTL